jgi:hypothetical protein
VLLPKKIGRNAYKISARRRAPGAVSGSVCAGRSAVRRQRCRFLVLFANARLCIRARHGDKQLAAGMSFSVLFIAAKGARSAGDALRSALPAAPGRCRAWLRHAALSARNGLAVIAAGILATAWKAKSGSSRHKAAHALRRKRVKTGAARVVRR